SGTGITAPTPAGAASCGCGRRGGWGGGRRGPRRGTSPGGGPARRRTPRSRSRPPLAPVSPRGADRPSSGGGGGAWRRRGCGGGGVVTVEADLLLPGLDGGRELLEVVPAGPAEDEPAPGAGGAGGRAGRGVGDEALLGDVELAAQAPDGGGVLEVFLIVLGGDL